MKHLLTLMAVALAIVAGAQTPGSGNADVVKYVADANKACPTKVNDALVQNSVALVGNDLTFEWTVERDDAFAQIKDKQSLVRDAKIAELSMTDPSENQLVHFMKVDNLNLVFNLANKAATDTVTIRISKQDLD